jgi:hypothetical protein
VTKRGRLVAAFATAGVLAAAGASGASTAAADAGLTYACDPPQPATAASCGKWHTTSVRLLWDWNSIDYVAAPVPGSDCRSPRTFDTDTAGTRVMCAVWQPDMSGLTNAVTTIYVDKTAPTVTGFTPDRPADHDGWWNHPVSLQFNGTDATSGIASCDVVSYSGPDGDGAPVAGACRDVAGNSGAAAFPIRYDATPPAISATPAQTVVGRNTLNWTTSGDAAGTRIVRSPGIGKAALSELYLGPGHTFTDGGVTGGRTYKYTLTALDAAGNADATTVTITAERRKPPRVRWRRVKGADYYNVQLYRGKRKVMSVWPHLNHFQLHRAWTFRGHKRVLRAGTYHLYVWPGYGRRAERRYGKLIVRRVLKVAPGQAAGTAP